MLSAADQRVVAGAAADVRDFQRQTNRDVTAAALQQLKTLGMQITTIDLRDAESVRRRLRTVLDRYDEEIGERAALSMYVALSQWRAGNPATQPSAKAPAGGPASSSMPVLAQHGAPRTPQRRPPSMI